MAKRFPQALSRLVDRLKRWLECRFPDQPEAVVDQALMMSVMDPGSFRIVVGLMRLDHLLELRARLAFRIRSFGTVFSDRDEEVLRTLRDGHEAVVAEVAARAGQRSRY